MSSIDYLRKKIEMKDLEKAKFLFFLIYFIFIFLSIKDTNQIINTNIYIKNNESYH